MIFNHRTTAYLKEVEAVKIGSKCKVFDVNFYTNKAFVNKQDTYRKRNGKICHVEHHFGKWIPFLKSDVSYGTKKFTRIDSSIYGLEEVQCEKQRKYLSKEVKRRLIKEYLKK